MKRRENNTKRNSTRIARMSNKDMKRNDVRKMRMSNDEEMMRPDGTLNGKKTSKGRNRTTETNQAEYDDNGKRRSGQTF